MFRVWMSTSLLMRNVSCSVDFLVCLVIAFFSPTINDCPERLILWYLVFVKHFEPALISGMNSPLLLLLLYLTTSRLRELFTKCRLLHTPSTRPYLHAFSPRGVGVLPGQTPLPVSPPFMWNLCPLGVLLLRVSALTSARETVIETFCCWLRC